MSELPLEYLPSAETAPLLSLGHQPALADLFWIRAVLYFAEEVYQRQRFEWILQYIELVIRLDPAFQDIYRWAGAVLLITGGDVSVERVRLANEVLEAGAERFPGDWQLPMTAMANCSYYIQNPSKEEAAWLNTCRQRFLRMAAFRPGAPPYLTLIAMGDTTQQDPGSRQLMCRTILDVYLKNRSVELKGQLMARIRGGGCGDMSATEIEALERQFDAARKRRYGYVPPDLWVHVVDTEALAWPSEQPQDDTGSEQR